MKNIFISILLFATVTAYANAEALYRWVDKDGKVHYGDWPAEDAVKAEAKKFVNMPAAGDDELSYTVRKAKQDFPVTLYVAPNCAEICVQARALLNKRGVPFLEKNLLTTEDFADLKAKTGDVSVPVLAVGKSFLKGFEAGQWNDELDIAGYPKNAPYGSRPQAAADKPEISGAAAQ